MPKAFALPNLGLRLTMLYLDKMGWIRLAAYLAAAPEVYQGRPKRLQHGLDFRKTQRRAPRASG